jgi:hypothetical protein
LVLLPLVPAPVPRVPLPAVIVDSRVDVVLVVVVSGDAQEERTRATTAMRGIVRISFFIVWLLLMLPAIRGEPCRQPYSPRFSAGHAMGTSRPRVLEA